MVLIEFTNIIVDDFTQAKKTPYTRFIHFLTHLHTDHYNGLNQNWDLGPIFCSEITCNLLAHRFPRLRSSLFPLSLNTPHTIYLTQDYDVEVTVTLLDANHISGAVMLLFTGYMGTILHTGDIRFDPSKFYSMQALYPSPATNSKSVPSSRQIDVLHLDNTFCDPSFNFPSRQLALRGILNVMDSLSKKTKIFVAVDSIGKEQLLVDLASHLKTLVVVDQPRYKLIIIMGFPHSFFTTNVEEGRIQVVSKKQLGKKMRENPKDAIALIPTGWANEPRVSKDKRYYHFPYSLHSSFPQLEQFVKSLKPAHIKPIVRTQTKKEQFQSLGESLNTSIKNQAWHSLYQRAQRQQNGLQILAKYSSQESPVFKQLSKDPKMQQILNSRLGLAKSAQEISSYYAKLQAQSQSLGGGRFFTASQSSSSVPNQKKKGAKLQINIDTQELEESRKMLLDCIKRNQEARKTQVQQQKLKQKKAVQAIIDKNIIDVDFELVYQGEARKRLKKTTESKQQSQQVTLDNWLRPKQSISTFQKPRDQKINYIELD